MKIQHYLAVLGLLPTLAYANDSTINTGDTAWVLVATCLVLMMTIPGLALFYAGMVQKKNILSTMMHSFGATFVVSVLWVVIGYSLAFGEGNGFIGDTSHFMLGDIAMDSVTGSIPTLLFVMFQMTFAIIAVAILAGSLAERVKFGAFLWFSAFWVLLVYAPVCHWVWGGGWLTGDALDFAGGTVVHVNAGVAGLVLAVLLGKRQGYQKSYLAPANLSLTLIGSGLLWVGWFGFNGGSALGANVSSAMAILVSQVASASGALTWLLAEYWHRGKASALGGVSGAIAGLVGITPAGGFVDIDGAMTIGILTALGCFVFISFIKHKIQIDDSLDAFGLHGVGGIIGAVLTGMFASAKVMGQPLSTSFLEQLWRQVEGVLATGLYCAVMTLIIGLAIKKTMGLRVDDEAEYQGLDLSIHGEKIGT